MLSNKIIKILFTLLAIISFNAEAKVDQFQDSFEGSFFRDIQIDQGFYSGSSLFLNNDVTLSTSYEILDLAPDFYYVFGSFARDDASRSFFGSFEFIVQFQDPSINPDFWSPYISHPIIGSFSFNNDIYLPDGEVYEQNRGWGELKGYTNYQGNTSFTIDWIAFSGAPVSNVPESAPFDLICFGLLMLSLISLKQRRHP